MAQETGTVLIAGTGKGVYTLQPRYPESWTVSQVSIEMAGAPIGATAQLRKNGYLITPLVATGDVAGGDPPVTLDPADKLTVEWVGCTPGAVGRVYVGYTVEPA